MAMALPMRSSDWDAALDALDAWPPPHAVSVTINPATAGAAARCHVPG